MAVKESRLFEVVHYCDRLLRTTEFTDWEGAANGLQVENKGTVKRIAAAVDGSLATVKLAIAAAADLLVVHHGLFWRPSHPWTGKRYELLRVLLDHNVAVYSSHLPLDAHPRLGNNARLCAAIGLRRLKPFFFEKGRFIGFRGEIRLNRDVLGAEPWAARSGCCPVDRRFVATWASSPEALEATGRWLRRKAWIRW